MGALSVVKINRELLSLRDIVLRQKAVPVPVQDEYYLTLCRKLALEMFDVMYASDGAGLAAPQVGISLRLVTVHPSSIKFGPAVLINPVIEFMSDEKEEGDEGCLSLPALMGTVQRAKEVQIKAYNLQGELKEYHAHGWLARIFQHEIDHLDGILYADRVTSEDKLIDTSPGSRRRALEAMRKLT